MSHPNTWPQLTVAQIDRLADFFAVVDASDGVTKTVIANQILDRLVSTGTIAWMTSLANYAAVDFENDSMLVWDVSAAMWKPIKFFELAQRSLAADDIDWMEAAANLDEIISANNGFAVWVQGATKWKRLPSDEIVKRIHPAIVDHTADAILLSGDAFKIHTNRGATTTKTLTLPAITAAMRWTFDRVPNYPLRVKPVSANTIGAGGANKYLEITTRGRVVLESQVSGALEVIGGSAIYDFEV